MSINVKKNGELTKIAGLYQTTAPIGMADCYSTEEKIVGCWTDGKPLYQRTLTINTIASTLGVQRFAHNIANVETAFAVNGTWLQKSDDSVYIGTKDIIRTDKNLTNVGRGSVGAWADNTNIVIDTTEDRSSQYLIITMQYTKTTDTPGSGQWTPSGDIAKHYSTEEQVIGTWIDGSTLYETTVSWPSVTAGGNTLITLSHGISNIAKIINFDFAFGSDSYKFKTIPLTDPAWFAMVSAVTQSSVQYRLGTSYSNYGFTITIQYIKTTD